MRLATGSAVTKPTSLNAADMLGFIRDAELAVIFVSVHRRHTFNRELGRQLAAQHEGLALGVLKLRRLLASGPAVLRFLHQGLRRCGAPAAFGVLPGYYLFRRGEMLAWDAGLPGLEDVAALTRSALLGALWSGVSSDLTFIGKALQIAADQIAAERVAAGFHQAIAGGPRFSAHREADPCRVDDPSWAYQTLGVTPASTDREVHEAWRRRRKESHPDHAADDPEEFERRNHISREINHARDVIARHRYPGARESAAGAWSWAH